MPLHQQLSPLAGSKWPLRSQLASLPLHCSSDTWHCKQGLSQHTAGSPVVAFGGPTTFAVPSWSAQTCSSTKLQSSQSTAWFWCMLSIFRASVVIYSTYSAVCGLSQHTGGTPGLAVVGSKTAAVSSQSAQTCSGLQPYRVCKPVRLLRGFGAFCLLSKQQS